MSQHDLARDGWTPSANVQTKEIMTMIANAPPPPDDNSYGNAGADWEFPLTDAEAAAMAAAFGIPYRKGMPLADLIWLTFAAGVPSLPRPFGFEGENTARVSGELPTPHAHHKRVDWLMRISDAPITVTELTPDPDSTERVYLGHAEFESHVAPGELGFRLCDYERLIHDKWGYCVDLQQKVIDTGDDESSTGPLPDILTPPITNKKRVAVPCVRPIDCDPQLLSSADRDSWLGRMVTLHMRNGAQVAHLDPIFALIRATKDSHLREQRMRFFGYNALRYKRIRRIYNARMQQAKTEGDLAMLMTPEEQEWMAQKQIAFIDETPSDVLARSASVQQQVAEGRDLGKRETHVQALLAVLRDRSIELSAAQKSALRDLDCAALPEMRVALHAVDAHDFVRWARLPTES